MSVDYVRHPVQGPAMKSLVMDIPEDLADSIRLTHQELAAEIRLMAALKLFELGKLGSGKAAELAGIPRVEFFDACGRYHVSIMNYGPDESEAELRSDLETIRKMTS